MLRLRSFSPWNSPFRTCKMDLLKDGRRSFPFGVSAHFEVRFCCFREGVCLLDPCNGGLKICLKYKAPRFPCPFSTRLKTAGGKATWPMTSPGEPFKKYSPLVIFTEWLYITSIYLNVKIDGTNTKSIQKLILGSIRTNIWGLCHVLFNCRT